MSYSAGLLNVTNLTANGASGSLQATNATVTTLNATNVSAGTFGYNNLDLSGNMNVRGTTTLRGLNTVGTMDVSGNMNIRGVTTLASLALPSHSNVGSALSVVEEKLNTIQPLVRDASLPTFDELVASQAQNYGNPVTKNIPIYTPDYGTKRISHKNRSVNICYPANTYKFLDMNYNEEALKKYFMYCDKFFPNVKIYPKYAHHNIQGREPFIFNVSKDASGNPVCVASEDVILGAEWYACGLLNDFGGVSSNRWFMLFDFTYADTGDLENFTGIPTHMRVITPLKNPQTFAGTSSFANGRLFINSVPLTTNTTVHAANVAGGIDSVLWSDSVLSLKARIFDNVQHPTAYTNILNTTTSKNVEINFDAVNFFRSPSFTNVYKAYSFEPEAFIQKGNATIQGWAYGVRPDTFGVRDSSNGMYDGIIAMPYNADADVTIKYTNLLGKYIPYSAYADFDKLTKVPDAKNNAPSQPNTWINTWVIPSIITVNKDGNIDMPTYSRGSTNVNIHEFTHTLQQMNLYHYKKDIEGQATYFECQPDIQAMGDRYSFWQENFSKFPKNCTLNRKTFLGPLTIYDYDFSFFYLYMSKYDTLDSEFLRNPRFLTEVWNVIQSRTYLSNGSDSIWGIGHNASGVVLTDASGELTQLEIYNKAYQAIKSDSSANIFSEHDNIVMASILDISQTEANTIYASVHSNIANWAFPDYFNIQAYKGLKIKEMDEQGELKPMVRTIISQAMRDAPKLNTFSQEFLVQKNYDYLKKFAENKHITDARTKGITLSEVSSIPGNALNVTLEPYSAMSINALQSSQAIISSNIVTVRTVYFPTDNNLTINDISPVTTVDGSGNNVYTYTVTTDSSNTVIAVINSTSNTSSIRAPGLLPIERLILGTTFFAPADIQYGVISVFSGTPVDAYTNITSPIVVAGKPTTNLTDMNGPDGIKIGTYADFLDSSGVSYVRDKIAICRRGVTGFGIKANNAWHAGAKGLIIIDNVETTTDLGMGISTADTAMNIPVWRIRPSWYHANIAPYLVASADNRYATTSFTANWALNYQYPIPVNPAGLPPSLRDSSEDYTIAEVIVDPNVEDM